MRPSLSHTKYINYVIGKYLRKHKVKTVLDVGGIARFKEGFKVKNANLISGIDGCNLPYKNNSFDSVISVNTIEHVSSYKKFINESIRVGKKNIVHCVPLGERANETEILKKKMGHSHPITKIPTVVEIENLLSSYEYEIIPTISIAAHLLYLTSLKPRLAHKKIWDFILKYGDECFGWIIFAKIGENI